MQRKVQIQQKKLYYYILIDILKLVNSLVPPTGLKFGGVSSFLYWKYEHLTSDCFWDSKKLIYSMKGSCIRLFKFARWFFFFYSALRNNFASPDVWFHNSVPAVKKTHRSCDKTITTFGRITQFHIKINKAPPEKYCICPTVKQLCLQLRYWICFDFPHTNTYDTVFLYTNCEEKKTFMYMHTYTWYVKNLVIIRLTPD